MTIMLLHVDDYGVKLSMHRGFKGVFLYGLLTHSVPHGP